MTSPFEVTSINLFSSWVFNLPKNQECTICRCNLNTPSLYNQEKGIDSYVVNGICQHSFHYECIKPWTDKNKHCPICAQLWQYQQLPHDFTDEKESINIVNEINNNIIVNKKINIINQKNKDDSYKSDKIMKYKSNYNKYIDKT